MDDGRWQLGDVILWVETGDQEDAKTDADVLLSFYDADGSLLCWAEAYERSDLTGFEAGEMNCGYLGNRERQPWLNGLMQEGIRLGIRIAGGSDDSPDWFVTRVMVDFRLGPKAATPTVRNWDVNDWIKTGDPELIVECTTYVSPGFDKELEIQSGGSDNRPR